MDVCSAILSGLLREGFRKVQQTPELLYSVFILYEQTECIKTSKGKQQRACGA